MFDEDSTEADEFGAFASLLSSPSSEGEGTDLVKVKSHEFSFFSAPPPRCYSNEGSQVSSNSEKSNMVCKHWKSKGWCRMESKCKFLHPEHKRGGVAAS